MDFASKKSVAHYFLGLKNNPLNLSLPSWHPLPVLGLLPFDALVGVLPSFALLFPGKVLQRDPVVPLPA